MRLRTRSDGEVGQGKQANARADETRDEGVEEVGGASISSALTTSPSEGRLTDAGTRERLH